MIEADEYASWRDAPVTRWVMKALETKIVEIEQNFLHRYFTNTPRIEDVPDMQFLRGQTDAYSSLIDLTHEELLEMYEIDAVGEQ